jgi:hypothetical protein
VTADAVEGKGHLMAVLVIADVHGQTRDGYDALLAAVEPVLLGAPGFIAHGAGPVGSGWWKTFEIWESQAEATAFFATHVHPNLPPGVSPRRTCVELHALVLGPIVDLLRGRDVETYIPGLSSMVAGHGPVISPAGAR